MKLAQHPTVAELLLNTGDAELVEDSPKDYFWGCGAVREYAASCMVKLTITDRIEAGGTS